MGKHAQPNLMDDGLLVEQIRIGNEKALDFLYRKHYRMMARLVTRAGGTEDDAQDVFQDALVLFWQKTASGQLTLTSKISTYLYAVCKNLWRKELERKQRLSYEQADRPEEPAPNTGQEERLQLVERCLRQMGDTCRQLLMYYYFDQLSMADIALRMGFSNGDTAKTKKYKCKQELDKLVKDVTHASGLAGN